MRADASPEPQVSVVLATRNRCAHALACIESILANRQLSQLLVIDQSDKTDLQDALSALADSRIQYVRSAARGVTNGRNLGIQLSTTDIVAFTDDDCRVASDWLQQIAAVFVSDRRAAVVCGRVRVPEEILPLGFTESFEPHTRDWQGRFPPFGSDWGITANLALQRDIVARVGTFDAMLGAGALLRSGGEPDFLFRVLRAGYKVINAKEVVVDHLGVRAYGPESQRLMRGYGFGTGAALFKHIRIGDSAALLLYIRFVWANVRRIATSLLRGEGPVGLGYLLAFFWGSIQSYRFGVDRDTRQFIPR